MYDARAESWRLLQGGPPADHVRLSRRVRHLPLAVDRDGDVAATMFLRRGISGAPVLEVHTFERASDGWRMLGGGGGGPRDELREPRPRMSDGAAVGFSAGAGCSSRRASTQFRGALSRWVWYAEIRLAQEVALLHVGDRRLVVAEHGLAVVVWAEEPDAVVGLDPSGRALGTIRMRLPRLPTSYRDS